MNRAGDPPTDIRAVQSGGTRAGPPGLKEQIWGTEPAEFLCGRVIGPHIDTLQGERGGTVPEEHPHRLLVGERAHVPVEVTHAGQVRFHQWGSAPARPVHPEVSVGDHDSEVGTFAGGVQPWSVPEKVEALFMPRVRGCV